MLISICIPSYNRAKQLQRLLLSIDCDPAAVEIVICEDAAPSRLEVREVVRSFMAMTSYKTVYEENNENLGYDGNIRNLIEVASGEFVLFMGDDDRFIPGALNEFIAFLSKHGNVGYVLRSYCAEHPDGTLEPFQYCKSVEYFEPSLEACVFLFKRTVSIAGVTFRRSSALAVATDRFDGTLLYQLYLVLEVAYRERSVFCDIPFAIVAQTYREDKPHFGASGKESRFEPGKVTQDNSIMFTQGFFVITRAFDKEYGVNISDMIAVDLSKYSYPILSIQRKNGFSRFIQYSIRLARETSINKTWHYYFYTIALALLGEALCDKSIVWLKNRLGYTPNL